MRHVATAAALLLLLLLAGGARALAGDDLQQRVADLGSGNAAKRGAAYRALAAARDPAALPLLRDAIPGWDHAARYYALLLIDRYPARQARRTWHALVEAEAPFVRLWAATALMRAGEEGHEEVVATALSAPDVPPVVRIHMLERAGWPDAPGIRESVRALVAPRTDLSVLVRVIATLHRVRDRAVLPRLLPLLAAPDADRRGLAAALLYDLGQSERAPVLAEAVRHGMGYTAFVQVAAILSPDREVAGEILDAATGRLGRERNALVLIGLIRFVGDHRHKPARSALRALVEHANPLVSRAAFDVLVGMSGKLEEDTLQPLLRGPDVEKRLWAAEALRRRDDLAGLPVVVAVLRTGTAAQRTKAAGLLGSFTTDDAVDPLLDALVDDHPDVRATAARSLTHVLGRLFPYRVVDPALAGVRPDADARERYAAAQRMRAWWARARTADW